MDIDNPFKVVGYNSSWEIVKKHILNVVTHFPNENKIISDEPGKILLLKTPTPRIENSNDRLLYVSLVSGTDKDCEVRYEMTNQNNKIDSFNEQQTLINHIEIFKKLVAMSGNNTLGNTVQKLKNKEIKAANAKKTDMGIQAVLQIIILIVAILLIFTGLKGCNY